MVGSFSTTRCTDNHASATGLARFAPAPGLGLGLASEVVAAPALAPGLADKGPGPGLVPGLGLVVSSAV